MVVFSFGYWVDAINLQTVQKRLTRMLSVLMGITGRGWAGWDSIPCCVVDRGIILEMYNTMRGIDRFGFRFIIIDLYTKI